jgi:hypothetical protein
VKLQAIDTKNILVFVFEFLQIIATAMKRIGYLTDSKSICQLQHLILDTRQTSHLPSTRHPYTPLPNFNFSISHPLPPSLVSPIHPINPSLPVLIVKEMRAVVANVLETMTLADDSKRVT